MVNNTVHTLEHGTHYPNRLFVGSLPGSATASDLAEFFKEFGTVLEGKVVLDSNGNSRRYGFITFACNEDVKRVLNQGVVFFRGKQVSVGPAVKRVPDCHSSLASTPQKVSVEKLPRSPLPPLSKVERLPEATTPPLSPVSSVQWQNVFMSACHPPQKNMVSSVHLSPTPPPLYIISCNGVPGSARPAHIRMPCRNTPLAFNSTLITRNGQICLNSLNHQMTL